MPDTKDFHGAKNILLDNDDWMVVDPLDYDAFVYYAPENYKDSWNQYRDGDTYFVIDKDKDPIQTSIIHKEDNKIFYLGSEAQKHRGLSRFEFESNLPDEVKSVVGEIIGHSDIYKLLVKVMSGEEVSSRSMENADDLIYGFKFNKSNPAKSLVRFSFSNMDEYVNLFDLDDDDKWFVDIMFNSYDSYEFNDSGYASDEWLEGYLIGWFNDENFEKLKEIVSLVAPQYGNLGSQEDKEEASKLLDEMFPREISEIYDDWVTEYNACKNRAGEESVRTDLCGAFNNYGIVEKTCFSDYYTTAGILLSLYKQVKDTTLSISEVLSEILKRKEYGGWYEYMYEIDCYDFDNDSFNRWTSRQLDKIYEKLEDSDEFTNVNEYSRIFREVLKNYPKDERHKTKSGREFFFRGVDPKNNRILIQVFGEGGLENRSYSEDEFNNFIVSPELFESKKIRKKY
jgi:hypothetical protein